ncbi:MAG: T9SS type A sorting domain-containing protein [Bacteroidia bacterium]
MFAALALAIQTGQIQRCQNNSALPGEALKLIDVINQGIQAALSQKDIVSQMYFSVDKALVYRLMNRYDLAMPVLEDVQSWVPVNYASYPQGYNCLFSLETQVLNGTLSPEFFSTELHKCIPSSRRSIPNRNKDIDTNTKGSDIKSNAISVYPNPASDELVFETTNVYGQYQLSIFDVSGKQVYSKVLTGQIEKLNPYEVGLSGGIYYYRAIQNGSEIGSGKFIITGQK